MGGERQRQGRNTERQRLRKRLSQPQTTILYPVLILRKAPDPVKQGDIPSKLCQNCQYMSKFNIYVVLNHKVWGWLVIEQQINEQSWKEELRLLNYGKK